MLPYTRPLATAWGRPRRSVSRASNRLLRFDELSVLPLGGEHVLALERVMAIWTERLRWCSGHAFEAVQTLDRVAQLRRIRSALRKRHEQHAGGVIRLGGRNRERVFVVVAQHLLVEVGRRGALVWRERRDRHNALREIFACELR